MISNKDDGTHDNIRFKCVQIISESHKQPVYSVSICEQTITGEDAGSFLFATCAKNQISVYKHQLINGNASVHLIQSYVDADEEEYFYDCKWTTFDDRTIVAAGGLRGVVRLIDVLHQRHLKPLKHLGSVNQIAFAGGEPKLMVSCCSNYTVMLWDALATFCLANFYGPDHHKQAVLSVDISYDGSWIVSGGSDNNICLWSTEEDGIDKNRLIARRGPVFRDFRLSPPHRVHLPFLDAPHLHEHYVDSVKFYGDKIIISKSADHVYCIWKFENDHRNTELLFRWQRTESSAIIFDVRFGLSIYRQLFAIGRLDGSIFIWNVLEIPSKPIILTHKDSKSLIRNIVFTRNGQTLIGCNEIGQLFVWSKA